MEVSVACAQKMEAWTSVVESLSNKLMRSLALKDSHYKQEQLPSGKQSSSKDPNQWAGVLSLSHLFQINRYSSSGNSGRTTLSYRYSSVSMTQRPRHTLTIPLAKGVTPLRTILTSPCPTGMSTLALISCTCMTLRMLHIKSSLLSTTTRRVLWKAWTMKKLHSKRQRLQQKGRRRAQAPKGRQWALRDQTLLQPLETSQLRLREQPLPGRIQRKDEELRDKGTNFIDYERVRIYFWCFEALRCDFYRFLSHSTNFVRL